MNSILFDFDGVILDSMPIRTAGFREIFKNYDSKLVDKLIDYHLENGGLSRFVKIKYFYESILKKSISNELIQSYAVKYSSLMKEKLPYKKLLIKDSFSFIQNNYNNFNMFIVSGSEQTELQELCKKLEIYHFFKEILGSPIPKKENVNSIIKKFKLDLTSTILIGDSINDYDAAKANNISFYGFNNIALKKYNYIDSFSEFTKNSYSLY